MIFVCFATVRPRPPTRYERYTTFAEKELHVMLRLTFFQVFNLGEEAGVRSLARRCRACCGGCGGCDA